MLRKLTFALLAFAIAHGWTSLLVAQTQSGPRRSSGVYNTGPSGEGGSKIAPASYQESSHQEMYYDDPATMHSSDWMGSCSDGSCGPNCNVCRPLGGAWARLEALWWSTRGMDVPALVTTSNVGTPRTEAGVLGEPGTRTLFGDDSLNNGTRFGGRITAGFFLDDCRRYGIEGDYFGLENGVESYYQDQTGNPIIARPFYDIVNGQETAQLIAFPNLVAGNIAIDATTKFQGSGVRLVTNLCGADSCCPSILNPCATVPTSYNVQMLLGYRFLRLDDQLIATENLISLDTSMPGAFHLRDEFLTENQFHGGDIGFAYASRRGCWTFDLLTKVAIGNTHSRVAIRGRTEITEGSQTNNYNGGLLAQRTNIGEYTADEFSMVPEIGATLGYDLNPCWRITVGYTLLYWSRVARVGDQIDTDINPNLLPPEDPVQTTHLRPDFNLRYTDFWATGLNLGIEARW